MSVLGSTLIVLTLLTPGRPSPSVQEAGAPPGLYVQYRDPTTGAAILVAGATPPADLASLLKAAAAGLTPPGVMRAWARSAPPPPALPDVAVVCRYIDSASGLSLTTDCSVALANVIDWLRPGGKDASTIAQLLTRMTAPSGVAIVGVGPYAEFPDPIRIEAVRGTLMTQEPPQIRTMAVQESQDRVMRVRSGVTRDELSRLAGAVKKVSTVEGAVALLAKEEAVMGIGLRIRSGDTHLSAAVDRVLRPQ